MPANHAASPQSFQPIESSGSFLPLDRAERWQIEVDSPSRQRLRAPAHEEEIGRTGEEKIARRAVPIHPPFDGQQDLWRPLYFIHGDRTGNQEGIRILPRLAEDSQVVQAQECSSLWESVGQGGFAGLAGAGQNHHRQGSQG